MTTESSPRAELLSPDQIEAVLAASSIVYVPLGSLEFHGPHLPIGLDGLTAHGVCLAASRLVGGIVLPTMYQSTGGEHASYPWTVMLESDAAIEESLTTTVGRLSDFGVETVVIVSGHFANEQRALIERVRRHWEQDESRTMRLKAVSLADCEGSPTAPDHAGQFESLLLAALHPELVRLDRLPDPVDYPVVDPLGDAFGAHRHDTSHPLWGVFGPDPREADFERAPDLLDIFARWIADVASTP